MLQWIKYDKSNAFIPSKNYKTKLYLKFSQLEKKKLPLNQIASNSIYVWQKIERVIDKYL